MIDVDCTRNSKDVISEQNEDRNNFKIHAIKNTEGMFSRIYRACITLMQLIFCLFAWVLIFIYVIIPISPIAFLCFSAKSVEKLIYRCLYGANTEAISSGDSLWMQDGPTNLGIINTLLIFDGEMNLQDIRKKLVDTMVEKYGKGATNPYRRVTKRVSRGFFNYFWTPESDFKIEDHVTQWPDTITSKSMLRHILSLLCSRQFDKGKSPWEFIVIPWIEHGITKTAAMFRVHHSMADGVSLVNYMTNQLPDNDVKCLPLKKFSERDRILMIVKGFALGPLFVLKMLTRKADSTLLHGKPLSGCKKVTWSEPLDFSVIKKIKMATKTTVNDVVVSCLTAALREFFNKRNLFPPQDLKVSLPIDLRKDIEQDTIEFENRFAILQLALPTGMSDPLSQLHEVKNRMDHFKFSGEPFSVGPAMDILVAVLPTFIVVPIFKFVCEKTTGVFSNVPGPQEQIRVTGLNMESFTFWPPQRENMGMSFSITSYNKQIFVGVESDSALLKDPHEICKEFRGQVKCLMNRLNLS